MKADLGQRITVIGVTSSGKTTVARRLSQLLGLPHIELDSLYWNAGWSPTPKEIFRDRVAKALCGDAWVTDGNYREARRYTWGWANTLVWLDYPLSVILWQLAKRTLQRILTKEELWNGNHETWKGAFFDKESLFLYAIQSQKKHRREYPEAFRIPEYAHLKIIHLKSRRETARWLNELAKSGG